MMDSQIIDDFAAVRLLINVYMIKKLKSSFKPVNQERFIEAVCQEFKNRNSNYSRKSILFTWKHLLDNYQHYKQNYTTEDAKKSWKYFTLMDNCFDDSKPTAEKFDDKWTLCLLQSLSYFKSIILKQDLTMDILEAVEDDFQKLGNYDINQKDIFNQWLILKKIYKKYLSNNSRVNKQYSYYSALIDFFEKDSVKPNEHIQQTELDKAVESITASEAPEPKKRKRDNSESTAINIVPPIGMTFTAVMQDVLVQYLKHNKSRVRDTNGALDDITLNDIHDKFKNLGYNVTKSSICNEWNDLSCRYELIKNSEHPEQWHFFEDMNFIYEGDESNEVFTADDIGNDAESENASSLLLNSQKVSVNDVKIGERLLNIYECNNKEFLEIKDILMERNLLREETNYLLNIFLEKSSKRKS